MKTEGNVVSVWQGKNGTFWCLMQYWVGTGFQNIEREIDESTYNRYKVN